MLNAPRALSFPPKPSVSQEAKDFVSQCAFCLPPLLGSQPCRHGLTRLLNCGSGQTPCSHTGVFHCMYLVRLPVSCVPYRKWHSLLSGAWRTRQRTGWTCTPARRTFSCQGSHLETISNAANADAWRIRRRIGWTCTPARRTPTWRSSGLPPPRRRAPLPPRPRPPLGSRLPLQRRRPPPARAPLWSEQKGRENDQCCSGKGRGSRQGAGRRGGSGCDRVSEHCGRLNDDMKRAVLQLPKPRKPP